VSKDKTVMVITGFSLMVIILGLQGIAPHHRGVLAATLTSDINSNNVTDFNPKNIQKNNILVTKNLANNLENHLQKAGAILEVTSKLSQVRNVSYAHLLNQTLNTLHGIPQQKDIEKRQVAKNILSSNSGFK
jgi:hypothetical protein